MSRIDNSNNHPFGQQFLDSHHLPKSLEKWREQFNSFFPNGGLTPKQFMKFVQGIEKMINAQIKQEQAQMKKASDKLKRSETGKD